MSLKIDKYDVWSVIKHFFFVAIGTGVLAFGTAIFLVPEQLVTGGVSGLAIVLNGFIPGDLGEDFYITMLTWVLFFLGWIFFGNNFALKTLLSTILYPIMYWGCTLLLSENVLDGYFIIYKTNYPDIAVLIAAVLGGACVGVGCAIAFKGGGSTGGVDVLALLFSRMFKKIKSSYIIFGIDAAIVIAGIFVVQDMVLSLLGIASAFICALMIDKVFLGNDGAYVAQIVSDEYEIITKGIIKQLDRTATIVDAVGAYSGEHKKMIIVSFSMREYSDLMSIIHHADPDAFLTISRAYKNHGEGWTKDKT